MLRVLRGTQVLLILALFACASVSWCVCVAQAGGRQQGSLRRHLGSADEVLAWPSQVEARAARASLCASKLSAPRGPALKATVAIPVGTCVMCTSKDQDGNVEVLSLGAPPTSRWVVGKAPLGIEFDFISTWPKFADRKVVSFLCIHFYVFEY